MESPGHIHPRPTRESRFLAQDVLLVLREQRWLSGDPTDEVLAFSERAAALLGPHVSDRAGLASLLHLVFFYDASQVLASREAHAVLARYGARNVLRELALFLLDPIPFDSDRFKEVVAHLKKTLELRGRDLFHPIRLALAGRAGEGELDRVILLVDEAAAVSWEVSVKSVRDRMIEFCSVLD